jgi:hypothetical protein
MTRQVVEIVGVAGAGKSTLARSLSSLDAGRHLAPFLDAGRVAHVPYLLQSLPAVTTVLVRAALGSPHLSWREFKLMAYIASWPRYLQRNWRIGQTAFILDQGPAYALGRLEALGKPFTKSQAFHRFRERNIATWAKVLTHLVVLDANDETLLQRIGARDQGHETKGKPTETGYEFLRRHRLAFNRVVAEIQAAGGPAAVAIDTGDLEADQLVARVETGLRGLTKRHDLGD